MRRPLLLPCAVLFGLALVVAALVHASHGTTARAASGGQVVRVNERDFRISVTPAVVEAGDVVFRITNHGPDAHELIVVHDDGGLPLRSDGITVDEEALTKRIVDSLEPAAAGKTRELRVRLAPGRYTLLCNMFGHFMGGMHATVVAR